MLYVSHGPVDHRERMRLLAIVEIEQHCRHNLRLIEDARRRRQFSDQELESMRRDIRRIHHASCRNDIILQDRGTSPPDRKYLFRRSGTVATGCFVTNSGPRPQLFLYGALGSDDGEITGDEVVKHLRALGDDTDIDLRINSPGGIVREANMIIEEIDSRLGQTRCFIDGMANSAASLVSLHCSPICIRRGAQTFIHFSGVTSGLEGRQTASDLAVAYEKIKKVDDAIRDQYLARWRGTVEELEQALQEERNFVDDEAVAYGLADLVVEQQSLATGSEMEEAQNSKGDKLANILDRCAFVKYECEFKRWLTAAKSMPYDGESLIKSIERRKRDEAYAIAAKAEQSTKNTDPLAGLFIH